jgi:predicted transcriptional regulator of viral defense system
VIEWEGFPLRMAELEKVLLDYLYLNTYIKSDQDLDGLRLNVDDLKEKLSVEKFNDYLTLFGNKALAARATYILKYLQLC